MTMILPGSRGILHPNPPFAEKSLSLNGTDAYVTTSFDPGTTIGSGDLTVTCQVNADTIQAQPIVLLGADNLDDSIHLRMDSNGKLQVFGQFGSIGAANVTAEKPLVAGEWYHVVFTRTGTTIELWVNGTKQASTTNSEFNTTLGSLFQVGKQSTSYFDGEVAQVAILTSVLSDAAIWEVFNDGLVYDMDTSGVSYSNSTLSSYYKWETNGFRTQDSKGSTSVINNNGSFVAVSYPTAWGNSHSYYFDGVDDYGTVDDHNNLSFGDSSTDSAFSVSAHIKVDSTTGAFRICSKTASGGAGTNQEYDIFINNGKLGFRLNDSTGGNRISWTATNADISANTWHHVAFTYDGGGTTSGMKGYVDGTETSGYTVDSVGSYTAMHNTGSTLYIGTYSTTNFNTIYIDNLAFYSKELTSTEVGNLTDASGNPADARDVASANLIFYHHGSAGGDWSGNGHILKLKSGATASTDISAY